LSVLIVEDDEVHRELLQATLKAGGHDVIATCNGYEALQELARRRVDIVLMDLQMPHVDGFKAATSIRAWERAAGGHLPIIAMSASALGEDQERCRAAGMDRFITKPLQRDVLFGAIDELRGLEGPAELPPELAGRPAFLSGLGDDIELARRLVSIFLQQSPRLMNEIRAAVAAGDAPALRKSAHALKGTISNFPPGPARAVAAKMESYGYDGDLDAARASLSALEQEVERLQSLLPAMI
jgi:CheY-like chemotaxis protein